MIFGVRRSKLRAKIDQKMKSSWEGILASIFDGFWWILEAKLAPCWGRKSIKKGIEKQMAKRTRLEGYKMASGPLLEPS